MKSIFYILLISLLFPIQVFAHGGFQKQAGNVIVHVNQEPLSPLIGEEVEITIQFQRPSGQNLENLDVSLSLIDTFLGDQTKDEVILVQNFKTDVNGAITFSHTFDKENYFDLDLKFKDPQTNEELNTGFLIQPRNRPSLETLVLINATLFVIIGIVLYRLFKSKIINT